jgi:ankyrin repeat protein
MRLLISLLWALALTLAVGAGLVAARQAGALGSNHAMEFVDHPLIEALQCASGAGDGAVVRRILNKRPDLVNCRSFDGWTPLHEAARGGHLAIARFLISKGADLSATNDRGDTPRGCAARAGRKLMAAILSKT